MDEKSNKLLLALVMLFLFAVIVLQYVCPGTECQLLRLQAFSSPVPDPYRSEDESSARFVPRYNFSRGDLLRKVDFDIKGDDLIVFLHIQKTGGTTFGRHLVRNIQLEQPCECRVGQKKCTCHRPGKRETWLFSRFSTGWSCGLHADWTELTSCVPAVVDGKRDARLRPSRWRIFQILDGTSKDRWGSSNFNSARLGWGRLGAAGLRAIYSGSIHCSADMAAQKDQQKDAEGEGLSATTLLPKLIPSGAGREWLERRRATIRPWGTFVDQQRFSRPRNVGELCQRLVRNVEYYQSNYVFVFLGLILYCVVTSPMLLVALAVFFGACYILYLRTLQSKLVLFGREVSPAHQYALAGGVSFPFFWLAGAGSAVFWVLGATLVLIGSHAAFHQMEPADGEELQMEPV